MRKALLLSIVAALGLVLCASPATSARVAPTDPGAVGGASVLPPRASAVAGTAGATDVQNLRTGLYFATIQAAIDDAGTAAGDVLEVQVASHAEGICTVGKAVTVRGGGGGAVITSTTDTGTAGDARAWFLVTVSGVTFQDLTFDGSANLIAQALRFYSDGTVARCAFQHIKRTVSEYTGLAVVGFGNLGVTDCAFSDCGRIGVILFGTGVTAGLVSDCTYTGKGDGDWLDYGVELGGGAVATLTNNTITACTGVALSDGSTSGGVLATTYFGAGTTATLTGNVLTGNTAGICAGYDASDVVVVAAHSNDLSGNTDVGVVSTSGTVTVDVSANWWGDNTAAGVAAAVSGLVDYTPWLAVGTDTSADPGFQGDFSTLWVDDAGAQTGTIGRIQEGINLVSGSTVNVAAGVYHERLTVNKSLQLLGAQAGVDPTPAGARTDPGAESVVDLVGLGIMNPNVLLEIPAGVTDVTVAGFTLNGSTVFHYADEATIRAWDDRLAIEDNIIDGYYSVLYKGNDHFAARRNRITANKVGLTVQPNVASDVTVESNAIVPGGAPAADAQGIYLAGVTGGLIKGNTISGFTGSNALGGSSLTSLVIEQNQLTGCNKGVNIWGTTTFIEIRQNVVTGHLADGIVIKGADLSIHNNVVTGNAIGVTISFHTLVTERVTVLDNDLSGNTTWGLQVMPTVLQAVNAPGNWFGNAAPAGVAAEVSGLVDFTPWLAVGTDTSADPGFQGDFSTLWVDDAGAQTGTVGRIQEGINLVSGSTVYVAPGSYAENVVVNKKIVLQGSGDGSDPLVDTILLPAAGTIGITIQAGGTGPTDRCVIRDLRISGGQFGMYTLSTLGYLTLQNLTATAAAVRGFEINNPAVLNDVVLTDVDMVANVSDGMRVRGRLDGLVVTNGHFDGNVYGLLSYTGVGEGNNFLNVSITGTTFSNNSSKGMYFEKLSDAVFDGITVANSGTAGSYAAGIDINLKYAAYQNIEIRNSSITGCGTGDLTNGVGVTVKARSDGGYSTYPATLTNVDLTGNTITGCQNGIRFGEPGKSNPGPTVVDVHECLISGSLGVGLDNASLNVPDVTCDWWGDALGPNVPPYNATSGDGISGSATWAPFWTTPTGPCDGVVPHVDPVTAGLCLSTPTPCVTVPVTFTRADATPARGISVTFQLGGGLELCGTPAASILQGTWLTGYDTQYGVIDNTGGSYTVDQAINGTPCGVTTGGQLFTLALKATTDGTGTVTITDVQVRDCDNAPLPGAPGAAGEVLINLSPPAAITALAAAQVKTGNDGDGTTRIEVSWPAVEAGTTVHVYRADYGFYPEYDDLGGAVPTYPSAAWTLAGDVVSGTTLLDEVAWPNRGFWYYVATVEDSCGNVSGVSNMTGGTLNYHLGDVMAGVTCEGNNVVGLGDVSLLGGHYGVAEGNALYLACLDVGPTTNRSVNARPTTDNKINFEDMMMFAINYGTVSLTTAPVAAAAGDAVWVEAPATVVAGQTFTASLRLSGSGSLLGLSAALGWDRAVAELVAVEPGELVTSQGGLVLHGGGGLVDCALLGADRRLAGEGELARVTFRALASGTPKLALGAVDARDAWNRMVELTGTPPTVVPATTSLAPAMPNPFRGTTTLSYALAKGGAVELAVYGVDGRKVATLASGVQDAGSYRLVWDGGQLRPGLYYARLTTPEGKFTRTLVLVK